MARDPSTYRGARRNNVLRNGFNWRDAGHFTMQPKGGCKAGATQHVHRSFVLTTETAEAKRRERIADLGRQEAGETVAAEAEDPGPS